jgi:serine/threonine protein kinase
MRPGSLAPGASAAPSRASLQIGAIVGEGLRLSALLGVGGMSQVWRAESEGRVVAVKLARDDLAAEPVAHELIRREHALLERFAQPHVVAARGLIEVNGCPALMMEYCGGGDLVSLLGVPAAAWARPAAAIARALAGIHARGWVHRDVKPRNVLFSAAGSPRLADFALAAPIGAPTARRGGTAPYQRSGRPARFASVHDDVHAFAVTLHALMSGKLPFAGTDRPRPPRGRGSMGGGAPKALTELTVRALGAPQAVGSVWPFVDVLESLFADCR